jgi:hypothetical protein
MEAVAERLPARSNTSLRPMPATDRRRRSAVSLAKLAHAGIERDHCRSGADLGRCLGRLMPLGRCVRSTRRSAIDEASALP